MTKEKSWWIRFREKLKDIFLVLILEEITEWASRKKKN